VTIRVIQWATGPLGAVQLAEVIDDPQFDLVGVFVCSPDKAGVDAGRLVGRPDTGVLTTHEKAAILALDADVVLHAARKSRGLAGNLDDIVDLLESGKSVVTVASYAHLPLLGSGAYELLKLACALGDSRFYAAGKYPGFMLANLAIGLTALSQRIDKITMQQFVDCSHLRDERILVDLMGMGKWPEEISIESPTFRVVSTQSEQAIWAATDALGADIDEIRRSIRTAVSPKDVAVDCTTLPAGSVVGQILSWTAYRGGAPFLVVEDFWTCTTDIPEWDLTRDGHAIHIRVDGIPGIAAAVSGDDAALGISAVRAIPQVLEAPVGVVVPELFEAFRRPV
jgi:2,4-diaminopentanoate dehydrogenase